eukprot:Nk52_evm18s96 gene=Nk52_evmTU18s96
MKSVVFMVCALLALTSLAAAEDQCFGTIDICVAVDSSGSIGSSSFGDIRNFIPNLSSKFNIGPNAEDSRMAIVRFASSSTTILSLASGTSQSAVSSAASGMSYSGGGTNILGAIGRCNTLFAASVSGGRDVTKVLVIVTDGQDGSSDSSLASAAGQHADVRFAIAVGGGTDNGAMDAIASDPNSQHRANIGSTSGLDGVIDGLVNVACPCPEGTESIEGQCVPSCENGLYHEGYTTGTDVPTFVFDDRDLSRQSDYQLITEAEEELKMYYDEDGETYLARACNEKREQTVYFAVDSNEEQTNACVQEYFYGTGGDYGRLMGRQSRNGACNGSGLESNLDLAYVRMVHRCQLNNVDEQNDVIHRDVCVTFRMKCTHC